MRIIKVSKCGNYINHGIGDTEYTGYSGTSDNGWSVKMAIQFEKRKLKSGEEYRLVVNGVNKGIFVKEEVR